MSFSGSGAGEGSPVPLRPAMVMQIRGSDEAMSPKSPSAKGMSPLYTRNVNRNVWPLASKKLGD
jgi:hypothetical protein